MADAKNSNSENSRMGVQAYTLAVICLVAGLAIGYLVRGSSSAATQPAPSQAAAAPAGMGGMPNGMPSPDQLRHMADKQAEPLLAQLKERPTDPDLLYKIGNLYYDAQQFPEAVKYYEQSVKINPNSTDVRTDLATAYHFMGESDKAIGEYDEVLKIDPKHANALFNEGMVKWQDKMDAKGAIASWKKLLERNPDYPKKEQVQKLIAQAEQHANMKPGTKTDKPAQVD
jgi:cytochrome c-type biogenesis protein CcmH/NrfG